MILFIVIVVVVFGSLHLCGIFDWVNARLNDPAPRKGVRDWELVERVNRLEEACGTFKGDIDKLKLASSFKEFKRGG